MRTRTPGLSKDMLDVRTSAGLTSLRFFAGIVAGAALLIPAVAHSAITVQSVRHWTAPDHTRIVIDLSGNPTFTHGVLSDPPRLVVNVSGAKFHSSVKALVVSDGAVEKVRMNLLAGPVAQIVVDLTRPGEFNVFHLGKTASKPHRIVIDIKKPAPPEAARRVDQAVPAPREKKVPVVVIDPGHGGEDPGAVGRYGLKEKDICLKFARRLKDKLEATGEIKVLLTRTGDYFIPLRKRTQIAKELDADVFVSIHMNASRSRSTFGTEIFFLSLTGATDEAAREVALRENAADLAGGISPAAEPDIVSILTDLKQTNTLARSSELAEQLIDSLGRHRKLVNRGVKQAGFTVLKSAAFPSVLVEVAFISNNSEATLLRSDEFHEEAAALLAGALKEYCGVYASVGSAAPAGAK